MERRANKEVGELKHGKKDGRDKGDDVAVAEIQNREQIAADWLSLNLFICACKFPSAFRNKAKQFAHIDGL